MTENKHFFAVTRDGKIVTVTHIDKDGWHQTKGDDTYRANELQIIGKNDTDYAIKLNIERTFPNLDTAKIIREIRKFMPAPHRGRTLAESIWALNENVRQYFGDNETDGLKWAHDNHRQLCALAGHSDDVAKKAHELLPPADNTAEAIETLQQRIAKMQTELETMETKHLKIAQENTRIVLERQTLERERDDYKKQLNNIQRIIREAIPGEMSALRTEVQAWRNAQAKQKHAEYEVMTTNSNETLADALNDGWQVMQISHVKSGETVTVKPFATLKRRKRVEVENIATTTNANIEKAISEIFGDDDDTEHDITPVKLPAAQPVALPVAKAIKNRGADAITTEMNTRAFDRAQSVMQSREIRPLVPNATIRMEMCKW